MADRAISALPTATTLTSSDLFVLSQSNQAKNTTWQTIIGYLATALDGHGGIADIEYTAPSTGSLIGTLTITLADGTTDTLSVTNGKGISSIAKTGTAGLVDTYTITYNDTSTSTFQVTNGAKGDTGDNWYVHIKWASEEPTSDADMESTPDAWIGIYSGLSSTAPTAYTDYSWYEYKGDQGDTGNGIASVTLESSSGLTDTYRVNFTDGTYTSFTVTNGSSIDYIAKTATSGLTDTYTVYLTDGTNTTFNVINGKGISSITEVDVTHAAGHTDVYRFNFNDGDTYTFSIYNGSNGSGSVSTVDGIAADNQNVPLLIIGQGAPTTSTSGTLKQRYFDETNSILYILTGVDSSGAETVYNWQGTGVTVDSALSTMSTNPVQNAVLAAIIGTGSLNTTAQNLVSAVNELLTDIGEIRSFFHNKKALIIGDSYNKGPDNGWGYYFKTVTGMGNNVTSIQQNGGGFGRVGQSGADYEGEYYYEAIAHISTDIKFDYIVATSGRNDVNSPEDSTGDILVNGINQFISVAKTRWPDANIYIFPTYNDNPLNETQTKFMHLIPQTAIKNGVCTSFLSYKWFYDTSYNHSDGVHLTSAGYQLLAQYIASSICGWNGVLPEQKYDHKNLLRNSLFSRFIINTKGTTTATTGTSGVNVIDGWVSGRSVFKVNTNSVSLKWDGANSTNGYLAQRQIVVKPSGHMTASAIINGALYYCTFCIVSGTTIYNHTFPINNNTVVVRLEISNGKVATLTIYNYSTTAIEISDLKLEYGNDQTLATTYEGNLTVIDGTTLEDARNQINIGDTITKEIYGNFKCGEAAANNLYFKIPWDEMWNLPDSTSFTFAWKSTTGNNTASGTYVSDGANALVNGFAFNTPYVGGQRMITVNCAKTGHGLNANATLNIPVSNAILVTYTQP